MTTLEENQECGVKFKIALQCVGCVAGMNIGWLVVAVAKRSGIIIVYSNLLARNIPVC